MTESGKYWRATSARWFSVCSFVAVYLSGCAIWAQSSPGRKLAADVLEVVAPSMDPGDTSEGPVDLDFIKNHPEIVWGPPKFPQGHGNFTPTSETLLAKSKDVVFRHEVWCMELAFKPVRMIEIDTPNGTKVVWYMVYRLRYVGGDLRPVPEKDKFGNDIPIMPRSESDQWRRVFPTLVLNSKSTKKEYLDTIVPGAKAMIAAKERIGAKLLDSIELQRTIIKLSTPQENNAVWCVAMWTDVDPRTNYFSVDVRGITNAQRIEQSAAGSKKFLQKTLVLNFFRPGDTINEVADPIVYGIPAYSDPERQKYVFSQYGVDRRLDHVWVYR